MTILVTRPSPAAEELVNRLQSMGKTAWSLPLIEFTSGRDLHRLPQKLASLNEGDLLIALSQHAIHFAHHFLLHNGITWPPQLNYYAIGHTTALTMQKTMGYPVKYPHQHQSSETLIQLPTLNQVAGKQVLILRGNCGRELLMQTLSERGAQVSVCECYQRCVKQYDGVNQAGLWRARNINTLVVTSGEMLQQLYHLFSQSDREQWLIHCQLVVASERLANLAKTLGWQTIMVADGADNDALLRTLK